MPIVSSQYFPDAHTQRDGSRYVTEKHLDSMGQEHVFVYLGRDTMDYNSIMQTRIQQINESFAEQEFADNLANDTLTTNHITKAQFVTKFREFYRNAEKEQLVKLASWLINRVQEGSITAAQIQNAFGFTPAQYTVFRDKLLALKANWDAVQAARGE